MPAPAPFTIVELWDKDGDLFEYRLAGQAWDEDEAIERAVLLLRQDELSGDVFPEWPITAAHVDSRGSMLREA